MLGVIRARERTKTDAPPPAYGKQNNLTAASAFRLWYGATHLLSVAACIGIGCRYASWDASRLLCHSRAARRPVVRNADVRLLMDCVQNATAVSERAQG